jgi:hypothetical protein
MTITNEIKELVKKSNVLSLKQANLPFEELIILLPLAIEEQQSEIVQLIVSESLTGNNKDITKQYLANCISLAAQKGNQKIFMSLMEVADNVNFDPDNIKFSNKERQFILNCVLSIDEQKQSRTSILFLVHKIMDEKHFDFTSLENKSAEYKQATQLADTLFHNKDYLQKSLLKFYTEIDNLVPEIELFKGRNIPLKHLHLNQILDGSVTTQFGRIFIDSYSLIRNQFIKGILLAKLPFFVADAWKIAEQLLNIYQPLMAFEILKNIDLSFLQGDNVNKCFNKPYSTITPKNAITSYIQFYLQTAFTITYDQVAHEFCHSTAIVNSLSGPQFLRERTGNFLFIILNVLDNSNNFNIRELFTNIDKAINAWITTCSMDMAVFDHSMFEGPAELIKIFYKKDNCCKIAEHFKHDLDAIEVAHKAHIFLTTIKKRIQAVAQDNTVNKDLKLFKMMQDNQTALFWLPQKKFDEFMNGLLIRIQAIVNKGKSITMSSTKDEKEVLLNSLKELQSWINSNKFRTLLPIINWHTEFCMLEFFGNEDTFLTKPPFEIIAYMCSLLNNSELLIYALQDKATIETLIKYSRDVITSLSFSTTLSAKKLLGLEKAIPKILDFINELRTNIMLLEKKIPKAQPLPQQSDTKAIPATSTTPVSSTSSANTVQNVTNTLTEIRSTLSSLHSSSAPAFEPSNTKQIFRSTQSDFFSKNTSTVNQFESNPTYSHQP